MNAPAFAGLAEAVRETIEEGYEDDRIFIKLYESLKSMKNITVHGGPEYGYDKYVPVLLFNIMNKNCDEVMTYLPQGVSALKLFTATTRPGPGHRQRRDKDKCRQVNTIKEADI